MKQPGDRAVQLLRPLKLIHAEPTTARAHSDRERVVCAMQGLVHEAPRRQLYRQVVSIAVLGSTAVAAGYAAVWAFGTVQPWTHHPEHRLIAPVIAAVSGQVQVSSRGGLEHPGVVGSRLQPEESITSGNSGAAALVLGNGAKVQLSPASQLVVGEVSHRHTLTLKRGTVTLSVPKLEANQELAVTTASTTVVVVGTRFWVSVVPIADTRTERTCVGVQQGTVLVVTNQGQAPLSAGSQWSSDGLACTPAATLRAAVPQSSTTTAPPQSSSSTPGSTAASFAPPQPARIEPPPHTDPREPDRVGRAIDNSRVTNDAPIASAVTSHATVEQSSLDAQNRLFVAAIAAQRAGQARRAADLLSELLTRYPDSPLAEQASRELARAQATIDGSTNSNHE